MKAAVLDGIGSKFEVREVELDKPKSGELLVKVAASGLCASDLNAVD
jgi:S-(hydroxymethyl)glutathione dehydrogenase/alcohol dehydrogenase